LAFNRAFLELDEMFFWGLVELPELTILPMIWSVHVRERRAVLYDSNKSILLTLCSRFQGALGRVLGFEALVDL
jgi:hypothetical protein